MPAITIPQRDHSHIKVVPTIWYLYSLSNWRGVNGVYFSHITGIRVETKRQYSILYAHRPFRQRSGKLGQVRKSKALETAIPSQTNYEQMFCRDSSEFIGYDRNFSI